MKSFFKKFLRILGAERRKLKYLVGLFLLSSVLDVLGIALIGPLLNRLNSGGAADFSASMETIAFVIVIVFMLKGAVAYLVQKKILYYSYSQQGILIKKIMRAYQRSPLERLLSLNSAEAVNTINNYTSLFASGVLMNILSLASNVFVISAIIIFLALQNLLVISVLVGLLGVFILFYDAFFKGRLRKTGEKAAQSQEDIIKWVNQSLGGMKEINLLGVDGFFYGKVSRSTDIFATENSVANALQIIPRYLIENIVIIFVISVLLIQHRAGGNISEIMALMSMYIVAAIRLMPSVNEAVRSISKMRFAIYIVDKLYELMSEIESEARTGPGCEARAFRDFREIGIDRVTYRYPESERAVLKGVSLYIKKGQSIGIIGKSGSGKTTLVNVVLGLLEPQDGTLKVDGVSVGPENIEDWRRHLAYIPQDIFLLDDTIARNIAFGVEDGVFSEPRLQYAVKVAQLQEFVSGLPEKLQTVVGERGVRLSGGQRQRIAIARAVYHDRDVIVMDEATSALDSETETAIVEAIEGLKGERTLIVIAHRHSTLKNCDYIYRLEDGVVVEQGTFSAVCVGA